MSAMILLRVKLLVLMCALTFAQISNSPPKIIGTILVAGEPPEGASVLLHKVRDKQCADQLQPRWSASRPSPPARDCLSDESEFYPGEKGEFSFVGESNHWYVISAHWTSTQFRFAKGCIVGQWTVVTGPPEEDDDEASVDAMSRPFLLKADESKRLDLTISKEFQSEGKCPAIR